MERLAVEKIWELKFKGKHSVICWGNIPGFFLEKNYRNRVNALSMLERDIVWSPANYVCRIST